jgi:RNase P subunit RPR2
VPQRVFCDRCGVVLYDGLELRPPSEVLRHYNGTCPGCEKTLSYDVEKVRILPLEEIRRSPSPRIRQFFRSSWTREVRVDQRTLEIAWGRAHG